MASNAISSVGVKFYRWSSSSEWEAIAEISGVEGPNNTRETIDVTTLDSLDGYREFIGSFRDGGNVNLTMNFTRITYALFHTDFESDVHGNYKVVLSDTVATTLEFEGLVTECPLAASVGNQVTSNVVIKITSKPLLYDNSSDAYYI